MNPRRERVQWAAIAVVAMLAGGAVAAAPATPATPAVAGQGVGEGAARSREVEMTYGAHLGELPAGARHVDLWLPYPVSGPSQEVTVLDVATPYPHEVLVEPRFGNSILHVGVDNPRQGDLAVTVKVRVRRRELVRRDFTARAAASAGSSAAPGTAPAMWLQPDRLVPLDDRIRALAADVTRGRQGDLEKERAIYDYVVDNMAYDKSGTGWGNGDIYWACDAKRGNCTDFHALFIGLSRAVGIPAKFEIGMPLPAERGQGQIAGYHCWAEFWLAGYGWVPVDASEARKHPDKRAYFFGALDENRVQFSIGRDLVLNPPQAGAPLNYFIHPYAEVDGKPLAAVGETFAYADRGDRGERGTH